MLRLEAPRPSEKTHQRRRPAHHEVVPAVFDLQVRFRRKIFAVTPKKQKSHSKLR